MSDARQAGLGVLAALLSAVIIFGSMILALTEGGQIAALAPALNATTPVLSPPVTPIPGQPTFTPSVTPPPTATPTPAISDCTLPDGWTMIEILPAMMLDEIAAAYGISTETLMEQNCMDTPSIWGDLLFVPILPPTASPSLTPTSPPPSPTRARNTPRSTATCGATPRGWVPYFVQRGDNLFAISRAFGISLQQLRAANCLTSDLIHVGRRLYVPNVPTLTPTSTQFVPSPTFRPSSTPTLPIPPTTVVPTTPSSSPTFTVTPILTTQAPPTLTNTPLPPTPTPTQPPPATPTHTPQFTPVGLPTLTFTPGIMSKP